MPNSFCFWDDFSFYITAPGFMIVKRAYVNWSRVINFENSFICCKTGTRNFPNIISKRTANPCARKITNSDRTS